MRALPQIKAAYDWMVASYEAAVANALSTGNAHVLDRLDKSREILERGLFVMLFAQFEQLVTEYFEDARGSRTANPNWTSRRGWDVPAYGDRRVPFETKLALVLDRRQPAHRSVLRAYALRNYCAHRGTGEPIGSIDQFVSDLYTWRRLLRRQVPHRTGSLNDPRGSDLVRPNIYGICFCRPEAGPR